MPDLYSGGGGSIPSIGSMIKVVTAIIGKNQGVLIDQPKYNCDYVAFTNQFSSTWDVMKPCDKFKDNAFNSKIHKILTHKYLDGDYFLWIDGGVTLKSNPEELVELMGDKNFLFFKHPVRDCLFDEAMACREFGRGNIDDIIEQYESYFEFPKHTGLIGSAVFVKKNNKEANAVMEKWWVEISRYSARDQISWPMIFQNEDYVLLDNFLDNKYFNYKNGIL